MVSALVLLSQVLVLLVVAAVLVVAAGFVVLVVLAAELPSFDVHSLPMTVFLQRIYGFLRTL